MNDLLIGIAAGLIAAGIGFFIKKNLVLIQNWRNEEIIRIARLIEGKWQATEIFSDDNSQSVFTMNLKCRLDQVVTGTQVCTSGFDNNQDFDLTGSFKDTILTFMWRKKGERAMESGATTVKLVREGELEGYGLYINPADGKVYTSTFTAKLQH